MANASLEDCQLFAQSEILQRDLFIAAKQQEDHPKKREDCVQHEAESVSASSLKINRFRNRWNSGEAQSQLESLKDHASRSGMTIIEEFTDEGYSGLRLDRPGLDQMRELAKQ